MLGGYQRHDGVHWVWPAWSWARLSVLQLPWVKWQWHMSQSIANALRERQP